LREIYAKAGLPLDEDVLAAMHKYHADNDPGVKGRVVFNLERDFGLTADGTMCHATLSRKSKLPTDDSYGTPLK